MGKLDFAADLFIMFDLSSDVPSDVSSDVPNDVPNTITLCR